MSAPAVPIGPPSALPDGLPRPPALSAVRVAGDPDGRGWRLGVIGKRTWRVIGDPFEAPLAESGVEVDPRFGLYAYPRNPVGRGYLIEPTAAAFEACRLPTIEDPGSLLTPDTLVRHDFVRWPEGPDVAGFGWLSYGYFPRSALLGAAPLVYAGDRLEGLEHAVFWSG